MNTRTTMPRTILCLATATLLWGQTDAGRITGTVTDASGAVIAGAAVRIQDERTNALRQVTTNEAGVFIATPLNSSTFRITATFPNFGDAVISGVVLQVGQ